MFRIIIILLFFVSTFSKPQSRLTFVAVSTTSAPFSGEKDGSPRAVLPKIYEMKVFSNVSNRFATTVITSKVKNFDESAQEATFSVVLPDSAYITGFTMEIGGKNYTAYIKEKEEAKQVYDTAVSQGIGAAHVAVSARDSNRFTVSVNIEPESKAIFYLNYEELLKREQHYELVINIHPKQPVPNLYVQVLINETTPLSVIKTPPLRSGNDIRKIEGDLDPRATITKLDSKSALVQFSPTEGKQKEFAELLGTDKEGGFSGQFVVQYDVERDSSGGEILVKDGYFVHFFAPDINPLPKHIIFVLDTSDSMMGNRMEQLKEAMRSIFRELQPDDLFHVVEFNSDVTVWNTNDLEESERSPYERNRHLAMHPAMHLAMHPAMHPAMYPAMNPAMHPAMYPAMHTSMHPTMYPAMHPAMYPPTTSPFTFQEAFPVNADTITKVNSRVNALKANGMTNIYEALRVAIRLAKGQREKSDGNNRQPLIMFLTDGEPTIGITKHDEIISKLSEINERIPIFSLSFGDGADRNFLKRLSLRNYGFARHIYEAADSSLQLHDFYKQISSPILADVTFKYADDARKLTKTSFPTYFKGSEIIVCGFTDSRFDTLTPKIYGRGVNGSIELKPRIETPVGDMERLWAYLTVQQLLEEQENTKNRTEIKQKALDIALAYSFVTPLTSLVVVKPNETEKAVGTEVADKKPSLMHPSIRPGAAGIPMSGNFPASGGYIPIGPSPSNYRPGIPGPSGYSPGNSMPGYHPGSGGYTPIGPSPNDYRPGMSGSNGYLPGNSMSDYHPAPRPPSASGHLPGNSMSSNLPSGGHMPGKLSPIGTSNGASYFMPTLQQLMSALPWLSSRYNPSNGTLTLQNGFYKLGLYLNRLQVDETTVCFNAPNATSGHCTLLSHCQQAHPAISTFDSYMTHFCTIESYAGVCCPT